MMGQYLTRDDMIMYARARLGEPCTEIEMEVEERNGLGHLHMTLQDTLDIFYRFNQDESSYVDYMVLRLEAGVIEYKVPPEIIEVIDVTPSYGNTFSPMMAWDVGPGESLMGVGGAGMGGLGQFDLVSYSGAMRYLADVKKLAGTQYDIKLHPVEHMLRVYPTPKSNRIAMAEVYRKAKVSEIFANIMFRDIYVERCKMQLGEILGKDKVTLPGGSSVDGDGIYNKAKTRYDALLKELRSQSAGPRMLTDLS